MAAIKGTSGKDTITVTAASATVNSKKLSVAESDVTVSALGGDDTIKVTGGNVRKINAGAGADTITVSKGKGHIIHGNSGNDTITIGSNAGTGIFAYGDAGNDVMKASNSYKVTFYGGDGNDKLTGGKGADKLYGNAGKDTLYGGAGKDTLYGGDDNDTLYGQAGTDILYGGAGNDTLYGGGGTDTLYGDAGNDTFVYADGNGNDTIKDYEVGKDTLYISDGSIKSTTLTSSGKSVVFAVGSGKITLSGMAAKTISLKDSRGSYTAGKTAIKLGSDFTGTMDATKYLATVTTIDGRNTAGTASITGNAKDNTIYVGKAGGTYKGGSGNDTVHITGSAKNTVAGGNGNDIINIKGSGTGNTVYGNDGNDTVNITSGKNSIISCGAGNDTINIDGGKNSVISGGAGTDTFNHTSGTATIKDYTAGEALSFADAITDVTVDGRNVTLTAGTSGSVTVENGVGKLIQFNSGDQKKNILFAENEINFGTDNSEIIIATGDDDISIFAQGGDDILHGGYLQNGGTGNDELFCGSGTQHMFGGDDSDKDLFHFSSDSYKGEIGIYDFKMYDDMIEFMDEGENSVSADSDPWRDGNDVCLRLSNGSCLRFVDYEEDMIYYADLHKSMFGALAVEG